MKMDRERQVKVFFYVSVTDFKVIETECIWIRGDEWVCVDINYLPVVLGKHVFETKEEANKILINFLVPELTKITRSIENIATFLDSLKLEG
jgi:hypothetical protein